jgi:hypothetical protein
MTSDFDFSSDFMFTPFLGIEAKTYSDEKQRAKPD